MSVIKNLNKLNFKHQNKIPFCFLVPVFFPALLAIFANNINILHKVTYKIHDKKNQTIL